MKKDDNPVIHIVDDDPSVRIALSRLVESMGWEARSFASAEACLASYRAVSNGCVILDVQMPHITGPQLQELFLQHGIDLPVVFLTAHGDLPTGIRAMKQGAVDFLQKPVDEHVLFDALERALARHAESQSMRRHADEREARLARLSPREHEVLQHMLRGLLNKQIADRMAISMTTVKKHRARVMEKMAVNSVAELVQLCEGPVSGNNLS